MKKPTDFSRILASYLTAYLPSLRNVTRNTVSSYCDTFRLLLTFCRDVYGLKAESLGISDFSPDMIQDFLSWLKNERETASPRATKDWRQYGLFSDMRKWKALKICCCAKKSYRYLFQNVKSLS